MTITFKDASLPPSLKKEAIRYFHQECEQYTERYSVPAGWDVLSERHHAILDMVAGAHLAPGSSIIDLGCGPGFLSRDLAQRGYCGVGLDGAPAMVEYCRQQAEAKGISGTWTYMVGDVETVPLNSSSFDAVISSGVIEYLPTDEQLIREAWRLLKPGGRFFLCVTNRYGYTVSLYALWYRVKKLPGMVNITSWLRRRLVGGSHGAMNFAFLPRKQRPSQIRALLARAGFELKADRYVQFTLLPAPFCAVLAKLKLGFEPQLQVLDGTPLRRFGSCYIVCAVKK